jgi:hypothetical protein
MKRDHIYFTPKLSGEAWFCCASISMFICLIPPTNSDNGSVRAPSGKEGGRQEGSGIGQDSHPHKQKIKAAVLPVWILLPVVWKRSNRQTTSPWPMGLVDPSYFSAEYLFMKPSAVRKCAHPNKAQVSSLSLDLLVSCVVVVRNTIVSSNAIDYSIGTHVSSL